ncbi:MAG: nuclear transport factor 2 family protein [Burkholderiaceae bacterium]|nr:nuclear transport factor 2 family protein [Burkholderiaceae bacterium]
MPRRRALTIAAFGTLIAGCVRSDPERELHDTIGAMAAAIEKRDPGTFLEALADDFTRESGAFGKHDAKRMLAGALLRHERISVTAVVTDVRIDGQRARAKVRVVATGGAGLLPERGQTWEFDSAWRREGGRWRVFNAEWREGL